MFHICFGQIHTLKLYFPKGSQIFYNNVAYEKGQLSLQRVFPNTSLINSGETVKN